MSMKFSDFGFPPQLIQALQEMGYEAPTPIQEQAIPLLMQGEDLIGQAQTGTGKTAAFGLPILEWLITHPQRPPHRVGIATPQALVMVPTRELALQVADSLKAMSRHAPIQIACLYGGQSIEVQLKGFRHPVEVVVGTPGRLLDHLQRQTLDLGAVHIVVLDEADRMLDMGFVEDVVAIMDRTPPARQSMLFSATMPRAVENIAYQYMKSPQLVKVSEDKITVDKIRQRYVLVDGPNRMGALLAILQEQKPTLAVVFCRTKRGAEKLCDTLKRKGFEADALHGDMSQRAREVAMRRFREGQLHILVATDLASRGLDVFEVSHVINYDLPEEPETYVHRIGRTGRMGHEGTAISLVFEDQMPWIEDMIRSMHMDLQRMDVVPIEMPRGRERGASHGRGAGAGAEGGYGRPPGAGEHGGHGGSGRTRASRDGEGHGRPRREDEGGEERRGGRGRRGGPGGPGGHVPESTMRRIRQRPLRPRESHGSTRGGHQFVGRQN